MATEMRCDKCEQETVHTVKDVSEEGTKFVCMGCNAERILVKRNEMFYGVLTQVGAGILPFEFYGKPRVSEGATLIAFRTLPVQLLCSRYAGGYGKILWSANDVRLHPDDIDAQVVIETVQEFQEYLR